MSDGPAPNGTDNGSPFSASEDFFLGMKPSLVFEAPGIKAEVLSPELSSPTMDVVEAPWSSFSNAGTTPFDAIGGQSVNAYPSAPDLESPWSPFSGSEPVGVPVNAITGRSMRTPEIVPSQAARYEPGEFVQGLPYDRVQKGTVLFNHYRIVENGKVWDGYWRDGYFDGLVLLEPVSEPNLNSPVPPPLAETSRASPVASQSPVSANSGTPVATLQADVNRLPNWTTETLWAYDMRDGYVFHPFRHFDSGISAVNVVANKFVLPWANAINFFANNALSLVNDIDAALRKSPIGVEYQNAPYVLPFIGGPRLLPQVALSLDAAIVEAGKAFEIASTEAKGGQVLRTLWSSVSPAQLRLLGEAEVVSSNAQRERVAVAEYGRVTASVAEEFVAEQPGQSTLLPRQLSLFDIHPAMRGASVSRAPTREWNELMAFLYKFEPKPNSEYTINGIRYAFDSETRLVRVATDKTVRGLGPVRA